MLFWIIVLAAVVLVLALAWFAGRGPRGTRDVDRRRSDLDQTEVRLQNGRHQFPHGGSPGSM